MPPIRPHSIWHKRGKTVRSNIRCSTKRLKYQGREKVVRGVAVLKHRRRANVIAGSANFASIIHACHVDSTVRFGSPDYPSKFPNGREGWSFTTLRRIIPRGSLQSPQRGPIFSRDVQIYFTACPRCQYVEGPGSQLIDRLLSADGEMSTVLYL